MHRRHRRSRTPDRQLDLFPGSPPPTPGSAPGWSGLPEQTRRAVTGLMTRLLIAHAGGAAHEPGSDTDER
jgi:hypothetical protein